MGGRGERGRECTWGGKVAPGERGKIGREGRVVGWEGCGEEGEGV